jgi:hypothetical protein
LFKDSFSFSLWLYNKDWYNTELSALYVVELSSMLIPMKLEQCTRPPLGFFLVSCNAWLLHNKATSKWIKFPAFSINLSSSL